VRVFAGSALAGTAALSSVLFTSTAFKAHSLALVQRHRHMERLASFLMAKSCGMLRPK
jgi:hypothetical protein